MKAVFADTFYYLALLNKSDAAHPPAMAFSVAHTEQVITTVWVLTELGDALCDPPRREAFGRLVAAIQDDPQTIVVPLSEELWEAGLKRYRSRPDKRWSLTDCISFEVMAQLQISEALTGDHHFEQAGFRALLR